MTNLEYIRQLPGMENYKNQGNCVGEVGGMIGLDMIGWCDSACKKCENEEATINGKPAPYLLACPVKPGGTVWINIQDEVFSFTVFSVTIYENGWKATAIHKNQCTIIFDEEMWGSGAIRTKEEAEKKLEEIKKEG